MPERLGYHQCAPPWVRLEHVARYLFAAQFVNNRYVIDCACGEGQGTEVFLNAGAKFVEGIDQSTSVVALARQRTPSSASRFQVAGASRLPVATGSADVYVCLETIEHVTDDEGLVREAARVVKPEGVFICSTPNRMVTNPGAGLTDKPWNAFHVREYAQEEFVAILRRTFGHIELYGQNPVSLTKAHVMTTLARWLPRHGAVTLNQALKLPLFVIDRLERHAVQTWQQHVTYEYLIAVCRNPRPA